MGWNRTPIEPLRWWVQKVLPTVYDDSLSFQELLGKVVLKINELIEQGEEVLKLVNSLSETITNYYTKEEIDDRLSGIRDILSGITGDVGDLFDWCEELNSNKADKSELRVVQNDVAALVDTKVDKITTSGPEKVYTVTGTTQGSRECWESSVANSIIKRDQNGRAQISDPVSDYDIANKRYVDTELSFVKNLVVSGNNNKVLAIVNGSLVAVPVTDLIANGDEVRY